MSAGVAVTQEPEPKTTETTVPGRLDRLPWSRWHWREGSDERETAPRRALPSPVGPYPPPRRHVGRAAWSPRPQASLYPHSDPYLGREVDAIVDALASAGPVEAGRPNAGPGGPDPGRPVPGRTRAVSSGTGRRQ